MVIMMTTYHEPASLQRVRLCARRIHGCEGQESRNVERVTFVCRHVRRVTHSDNPDCRERGAWPSREKHTSSGNQRPPPPLKGLRRSAGTL
jgi:hypothetical protein